MFRIIAQAPEPVDPAGALLAHRGRVMVTRSDLAAVTPPVATATFQPIPHVHLVNSLIESLAFRHIAVVREQFAMSTDAMKLFGVLELETEIEGCRFLLEVRNANDRSMRLALTVGFRVFVCDNLAFHGDFTPVLAKHSRRFCLEDALAIGIDRMQRNFDPMRRQVANWRAQGIDDSAARVLIYRAFIERELEAPVHLAKEVHRLYFNPEHAEFAGRTLWSLQNAFTGALKLLEPIPQFKATASLARFFDRPALALPA